MVKKKVCKDCNKEFISNSNRQVRCPECQALHRKETKKDWARKNLLKEGFEIRENRRIRRKSCIGSYQEKLGTLPAGDKDPHLWWIDKDGKIQDKHTLVREVGHYRDKKTGELMNKPLVPSKERAKEWEEKFKHLKSFDSPQESDKKWMKSYLEKCNQEAGEEDLKAFVSHCDKKGRKKIRRLYRYKGMIFELTYEEYKEIIEGYV